MHKYQNSDSAAASTIYVTLECKVYILYTLSLV